MDSPKIDAHRITKPIQLMAVWFIALFLIDSVFLTAACKLTEPSWISPILVISAIVFVPLFLIGVFLVQTVFRKELQDDKYYSEWLKRKEESFKNFQPENILSSDINPKTLQLESVSGNELENIRINKYKQQQGLFLVHIWRPSIIQGQVADIVIWLHQHGEGPISKGEVDKVEYELGRKFFQKSLVKRNSNDLFRLDVSAYGPMLCVAKVFLKGHRDPLILERYINFD